MTDDKNPSPDYAALVKWLRTGGSKMRSAADAIEHLAEENIALTEFKLQVRGAYNWHRLSGSEPYKALVDDLKRILEEDE
jgi:hypothetical protein